MGNVIEKTIEKRILFVENVLVILLTTIAISIVLIIWYYSLINSTFQYFIGFSAGFVCTIILLMMRKIIIEE